MPKRRTKQKQMRAAARRAGKPSGKSRYALKMEQQRRGHFRPQSPCRAVRVRRQRDEQGIVRMVAVTLPPIGG